MTAADLRVSLEDVAAKIRDLYETWKRDITKDTLACKWAIGREISAARVQQEPKTFRELEGLTGINNGELVRCVQFFQRYPKGDYELKPWRQHIDEFPDREKLPPPPLPNGVFRTVVLDPPWPVEKIDRLERPNQGAQLDYSVMSLEGIAALPVKSKAADGCHVYLWVTHKFLPTGLDLFERWGVNYECMMTWVKPTGMTPYSWMYNTEHVLFGRVGNLPLERKGLKLSFEAPVVRHSEKPDIFYELVRQASPEPRLEMFARKVHDGFEAWGNEILLEVSA